MREQKARNDLIRKLYKPGMGGIIGIGWGISRQRVWQIKSKKKPGMWRQLWKLIRRH